jgi:hypothetical protein
MTVAELLRVTSRGGMQSEKIIDVPHIDNMARAATYC